jgi:hypothetical protein
MNPQSTCSGPGVRFEIRFRSLFNTGRGLAFPCDASGRVDLDTLPERGRTNYLFARAMVGREYAVPEVRAAFPQAGQAIAA